MVVTLCVFLAVGCKKRADIIFEPKQVVYNVKGTHFRVSYIDSNSVFVQNQFFRNEFTYVFRKSPGSPVGMSINTATVADTVYSWGIALDGRVFANAFSPGTAYLNIPFD